MRKYILSISVILSVQFTIIAQESDTLYGFSTYLVSDSSMTKALTEVIETAKEYPYFKSLNKSFFLILDFTDSIQCSFRVFPQNVTTICFYKGAADFYQTDGVCVFKGIIVYIMDYSDNNVLSRFFKKTDYKSDIYITKNENISEHLVPFNDFIKVRYFRNGNVLVRDTVIDEDYLNRYMNCGFVYLVKEGDTWETIAEKCGCDVINLKMQFAEYERPIPGFLLRLKYVFDEFGCFHGVTRID